MKTITAFCALFVAASCASAGEIALPKTAKKAVKPAMAAATPAPSAYSYSAFQKAFASAKGVPAQTDLVRWMKGVLIFEDQSKPPQGVIVIGQFSGTDGKKITVNKLEYSPADKYDAGFPDFVIGGIKQAMKDMNENPSVCSPTATAYECVWTDGVNREVIHLRKGDSAFMGEVEYAEAGQPLVRSYFSCSVDITPRQ